MEIGEGVMDGFDVAPKPLPKAEYEYRGRYYSFDLATAIGRYGLTDPEIGSVVQAVYSGDCDHLTVAELRESLRRGSNEQH